MLDERRARVNSISVPLISRAWLCLTSAARNEYQTGETGNERHSAGCQQHAIV